MNSVRQSYYDFDQNRLVVRENAQAELDGSWPELVQKVAREMDEVPYKPRLEAALKLVLDGRVDDEPFEDGVSVRSNGHTYKIDPEQGCTCVDSRTRSAWCKHRTAVEIYRRARTLMFNGQASPPVPEHSPSPLPEAPVSANTYIEIRGARVQVTIRGFLLGAVMSQIEELLSYYPHSSNGGGSKPPAATPPPEPAPEPEERADWCFIHQCKMFLRENQYGSWFSHMTEDGGFCKGKAPRNGRRG